MPCLALAAAESTDGLGPAGVTYPPRSDSLMRWPSTIAACPTLVSHAVSPLTARATAAVAAATAVSLRTLTTIGSPRATAVRRPESHARGDQAAPARQAPPSPPTSGHPSVQWSVVGDHSPHK